MSDMKVLTITPSAPGFSPRSIVFQRDTSFPSNIPKITVVEAAVGTATSGSFNGQNAATVLLQARPPGDQIVQNDFQDLCDTMFVGMIITLTCDANNHITAIHWHSQFSAPRIYPAPTNAIVQQFDQITQHLAEVEARLTAHIAFVQAQLGQISQRLSSVLARSSLDDQRSALALGGASSSGPAPNGGANQSRS